MKLLCIYIYPDKEVAETSDKQFSYFKLVDEKGNEFDKIDYIDIKGDVRIDVEKINNKKVVRLFPPFPYDYLNYDEEMHTLTSVVECEKQKIEELRQEYLNKKFVDRFDNEYNYKDLDFYETEDGGIVAYDGTYAVAKYFDDDELEDLKKIGWIK